MKQITLQDNIHEVLIEEVLSEILTKEGELQLPFLRYEGSDYYANGWSVTLVDEDLPIEVEEMDGEKFLSDEFAAFIEYSEVYNDYDYTSVLGLWTGDNTFSLALTYRDSQLFDIFEVRKESK